MEDKEDYLTAYRVFFEKFATTVNPEDQLPVQIGGYPINEAELTGEILYWTSQYLTEKECPLSLMTPLQRIILEEVKIAINKQPLEFGYNPDESEYIPLRLMRAVMARMNEVCLRYLDNAQLDTLPPPTTYKGLLSSSAATKNRRRSMEDRHVEIDNLEALFGIETTEPTTFYAVYDGHAGPACASYCAAHLHQYLVESPNYRDNLTLALSDAFIRTDQEFVKKSNEQNVNGGSTAVAVCVRQRKLVAAWAGDSQALLVNRMRLMQLVNPHKPSRKDEQQRIKASGGTIVYWGTWRVNGQLAVSRAIGDAKCKPYVTASPEVISVDLDGGEDFVVIACDGLWDFVSEDQVALAVYYQLASKPDNLTAVSKQLVQLAKVKRSQDNISVIVVFLKDPHRIVAENRSPMEIGLDNPLATSPAFSVDSEACKSPLESTPMQNNVVCEDFAVDNGVDNGVDSDSDSEDLGPETAVDMDDVEDSRHLEPAAPTPLVDTVVEEEETHIDGVVEDNVAESGEDSEDEWNYIKGEGETDKEQGGSDEPPRSETPCQDTSAWESSSADMNSSPLNPDAPVFIPGVTGGPEVLLAESPFKPLPMDESEQPDMEKFVSGALERPNELLDLDNCDQLNGHHNISLTETITENLNGNEKIITQTIESDLLSGLDKDNSLIQDLERVQKDTTDFCNIQVFQTQADVSPLSDDIDNELMERLKSKEADPMSMSFYRDHDDLNAVHELPDNDDDTPTDNDHQPTDHDKENVQPNNDINSINNLLNMNNDNTHNYDLQDNRSAENTAVFEAEIHMEIPQTETPESHKLLFEQIPEIPDGKNSELGFSDIMDDDRDIRVLTPQDEISEQINVDNKTDDLLQPYNEPDIETIKQDIAENIVSDNITDIPQAIEEPTAETMEFGDNAAFDSVVSEANEINRLENDFALVDSNEIDNKVLEEINTMPVPATEIDFCSSDPAFSEPVLDICDETKLPHEKSDNISAFDSIPHEPQIITPEPEIAPSPVPEIAPSPVPEQSLIDNRTPEPEQLSTHENITLAPEEPSQTPDLQKTTDVSSHLTEDLLATESSHTTEDLFQAPEQPTLFVEDKLSQMPDIPQEPKIESSVEELLHTPADPIPAVEISQTHLDFISNSTVDFEPSITNEFAPNSETIPAPVEEVLSQKTLIETQASPLIDTEIKEEITPDIVPTKTELIEAAKALAQEICVPVTEEIAHQATPPPTPAVVEPSAPKLDDLLNTTSAEQKTAAKTTPVAKAATKTVPKTTTTPRTPASGVKKTAAKPTPTSTSAATPRSATKLASKPATPLSRPASKPTTPAAKSTTATSKPTTITSKPTTTTSKPATTTSKLTTTTFKPTTATSKPPAATSKPAATRVALTKPSPPKKEVPVKPTTTKPLTTTSRLTAKPAPKPSTALPAKAPVPRAAPRVSRPATTTAATRKPVANGDAKPTVPATKKPLTNGDVKPATKVPARPKPTPRTNSATVTDKSKPVPRPAARAPSRPTTGKEKPITKPTTKSAPPEAEALPDVIA